MSLYFARDHYRRPLAERWNVDMTAAGFVGSEFIDAPETIARLVRDQRDELARLRLENVRLRRTTPAVGPGVGDVRAAVPAVSAPDYLSGDEGETVFIRRDLALTETAARAWALEHDGSNLRWYEADEVEMLPVPEHFTELEVDWAVVESGTTSAVAYWRFSS